jgi:hypothetical protein
MFGVDHRARTGPQGRKCMHILFITTATFYWVSTACQAFRWCFTHTNGDLCHFFPHPHEVGDNVILLLLIRKPFLIEDWDSPRATQASHWLDWRPGSWHWATLPHDVLENCLQAHQGLTVHKYAVPLRATYHWFGIDPVGLQITCSRREDSPKGALTVTSLDNSTAMSTLQRVSHQGRTSRKAAEVRGVLWISNSSRCKALESCWDSDL